MTNVKFDNVYLLYIFIPLILLVIIPFFITIRKKRLNFHNIFSLLLHVIICALISLSLSGFNISKVMDSSIVYIVADASDTTKDITDSIDQYINEYHDKLPDNAKLGVVAFAKDAQELVKPGSSLKSINEASVDRSATNIQEALSYTAKLFDDDKNKKMILLTDGKETDGNALSSLSELSLSNISLDAVYFDSDLKDEDKEMQIQNITGNPATFKDKNDQFQINIISNYATTANLTITNNDQEFYNEEINLNVGVNEFSIKSDTSVIGSHIYKATITSELDKEIINNTYYFNQDIHEKCNILVITSTNKDYLHIKDLIGEDDAQFDVKLTYNSGSVSPISNKIEDYIIYDQIILSNLNLQRVPNYNDFVNTLELLVANYGKSVITLGGSETYFDGSFFSTKLKDMLPVDINPEDTKQRTSLILLIDNSGSMDDKLEMAKEGAKAVLDVLTDKDLLGIITFAGSQTVLKPLAEVRSESNRAAIKKTIDRISVPWDSGTIMTPSLEEALDQMRKNATEATNREVIVISDGQPSDGGQEPVISEMASEGIRVSTISIGSFYENNLMASMAKLGNGEYYKVDSAVKLPSTMLSEVTKLIMDTNVLEELKLNIKDNSSPIVDGINANSLPTISGINFSKAKYNATTILATDLTLENGTTILDVPIFTYWNYGKGKVSSFMSDDGVDGNDKWALDLFNSNVGKKLFKQIIKSNYPDSSQSDIFQLEALGNGYTSNLQVSVPSIRRNFELSATITDPNGNKNDYTFTINNGKYTQTINTDVAGSYSVYFKYSDGLSIIEGNSTFTYSYSKEYDKFIASDNILLWQLTESIGTVGSKDNVDELINFDIEDDTYNIYFNKQFLIIALILFIIDVGIRMLRWKDIKSLFKRNSKETLTN